MKERYGILFRVIIVEMIILFVMSKIGIRVKSEVGNAIGVLLMFLPIELLLFIASKDQNLKTIQRIISKVWFWVIVLAYVGVIIVKLLV